MITQLFPNLFIGDLLACSHSITALNSEKLLRPHVTVHAAKDPCHRHACGEYDGNLPKDHPAYLWKESDQDLYLNMIDSPQPLFRSEVFLKALSFIDQRIPYIPVVIHCNLGQSRAPAIALVYSAYMGWLPCDRDSFVACADWLQEEYADLHFSSGIKQFLSEHWSSLIRGKV